MFPFFFNHELLFSTSYAGKQEVKTKVISKTVNPVWEDTLSITIPTGEATTLVVKVYDHNSLSKNDPLGMYTMTLPSMSLPSSFLNEISFNFF